jgi:L-ascorbate metabolism protein UlaG (beta-lactamase superfamily)
VRVEWFGQSAFALRGEAGGVFIDPFGDVSALAGRGLKFEFPAIETREPDLVLVTHEHLDHNGVEVLGGEPTVLRTSAGRHQTPLGEVVGIVSEHDPAAGTERGANTIFSFELDAMRVCHFGDFGQAALRPEQIEAIGSPDLLFLPVGGRPTIGGAAAAEIAATLGARWVVPMHYRTPRIGFLETEEEFVAAMPRTEQLGRPFFETAELSQQDDPVAIVPASP